MANPRQRRKQRSGTSKLKFSKGSRKSQNKVVLKAPEVLIKNWDKTKTVRQNYRALGLLPTLNPRQAGGIEPIEGTPYALQNQREADWSLEDLDDDEEGGSEDEGGEDVGMELGKEESKEQIKRPLAVGEGRIERDPVTGKVLRVVVGGANGQEVVHSVFERPPRQEGDSDSDSGDEDDIVLDDEDNGETPWGKPMGEWEGEQEGYVIPDEKVVQGPRRTGQGIPIGVGKTKVLAKTDVVLELEALAAREEKKTRFTSALEGDWLLALVDKYGDDVEKMVRDRKLNPWQKTPGEIKRAITKAGGFSKLKAKLAELKP
ncbi:hypothetical protein T439DRAFT_329095 [Meredithblackwellia eburnea MCA 4105]